MRKSPIFPTSSVYCTHNDGFPLELGIGARGWEKLVWWSDRNEQEVWRYLLPRGYNTPTQRTDGRTDGHQTTAKTALTHRVARVKIHEDEWPTVIYVIHGSEIEETEIAIVAKTKYLLANINAMRWAHYYIAHPYSNRQNVEKNMTRTFTKPKPLKSINAKRNPSSFIFAFFSTHQSILAIQLDSRLSVKLKQCLTLFYVLTFISLNKSVFVFWCVLIRKKFKPGFYQTHTYITANIYKISWMY